MDSPRGRIVLMKEVLEGGLDLEEALAHVDPCLGCISCVTACPSGVEYGELLMPFRELAEGKRRRSRLDRLWRGLMLDTLANPGRLRWMLRLGRLAAPFRGLLRALLSARLAAPLDLLPRSADRAEVATRDVPGGGRATRPGCSSGRLCAAGAGAADPPGDDRGAHAPRRRGRCPEGAGVLRFARVPCRRRTAGACRRQRAAAHPRLRGCAGRDRRQGQRRADERRRLRFGPQGVRPAVRGAARGGCRPRPGSEGEGRVDVSRGAGFARAVAVAVAVAAVIAVPAATAARRLPRRLPPRPRPGGAGGAPPAAGPGAGA